MSLDKDRAIAAAKTAITAKKIVLPPNDVIAAVVEEVIAAIIAEIKTNAEVSGAAVT